MSGRVSLGSVNVRRFTTIGTSLADLALKASVTVPVLATGQSISAGVLFRYTDDNNFYLVQLLHDTAGTIDFELVKRVAGTFTPLATISNFMAYTPGVPTRVRARCVGTALAARIWRGTSEPGGWQLTATDAAFSSGKVGTHSNLVTGNSNTLPVVVEYDDLDVLTAAVSGATSPQTFTVVRSVNGVVKTQTTGTELKLAQPARYAL